MAPPRAGQRSFGFWGKHRDKKSICIVPKIDELQIELKLISFDIQCIGFGIQEADIVLCNISIASMFLTSFSMPMIGASNVSCLYAGLDRSSCVIRPIQAGRLHWQCKLANAVGVYGQFIDFNVHLAKLNR